MSALGGKVTLVTGATGFIGAAVAGRLRAAGAVVHGVARHPPAGAYRGTRWWQVDVTDLAAVRDLLAAVKPDIVVHLAGLAYGARDLDGVVPMLHVNLLGVVNLLVAATERRVSRLVFGGSLEEKPDIALPVPSSPYAAAKLAGAAYARMCHALYGTPAVWLRPSMVYGPGQRDVRKLIPHVIVSLLRGEAPALSSGTRPVDWIYIEDVVDAVLAAAVAEGVDGRTLDVACGELVTVRDVVGHLCRLIDPAAAPRFGALPERPLEQARVPDVESTAACLGWRARTPLLDGLRATVEWYRGGDAQTGYGVAGR